MNDQDNIFNYIRLQETAYKQPISINEKWEWNMYDHVLRSELYNNSQLMNGKTEYTPVKNITRPILNLQHRTEDIDVKDVQIFVDDLEKHYLSLLVKKYHDDVFVVENDMDSFFDELNNSRIDFGGGLSKQLNKPCPEVVPLQSIAFCDQTDMLSGPIGIKHYYSPDQLLDMEKVGWGSEANGATISVPDLIKLSQDEKRGNTNARINKTPGRYVEVYEVHGNLPKKYSDIADDSGTYQTSIFIVAYYQKKNSKDMQGVVLYTKPESESPFKLVKRDPVYGRALGFGGAEELFEAQVWVNLDMIRMQGMLDATSKTILGAKGANSTVISQKNDLKNLENLSIIDLGDSELEVIDTVPRSIQLFERSVQDWEAHAKDLGGAPDTLQGQEPTAGTPFSSLQAQIQQGIDLHEYRRGQYAKHLEDIYMDWIIPHIEKQITKGATFISELSLEELQYVTDAMVTNEMNKMLKQQLLDGNIPDPSMIQLFQQQVRDEFKKRGNKHFIEILKIDFKDAPLAVKVNIAGKQKNLAGIVDKITNIFRFAFSNPQGFAQVMQIPGMAKSFNEILEYSGLSPADFSGIDKMAISQPSQPAQGAPQGQSQPSPMQPQLAAPQNA